MCDGSSSVELSPERGGFVQQMQESSEKYVSGRNPSISVWAFR